MQKDHNSMTSYVISGQCLLNLEPYDVEGASALLNSVWNSLGDAAPSIVNVVSRLHLLAAAEGDEDARRNARRGMACLIEVLERKLTTGATADATDLASSQL